MHRTHLLGPFRLQVNDHTGPGGLRDLSHPDLAWRRGDRGQLGSGPPGRLKDGQGFCLAGL